jgi:L-aminopeptidase/D-esterase-like protein
VTTLTFDLPGLRIGTADCDGQTGVTVFHFPNRAKAAVDVRGGAPGTYNVDYLRLGYDRPNLDAICIAGGSWYGLAAAPGVARALAEDGLAGVEKDRLANITGAIIYDYGVRRSTTTAPDAETGARALRAAVEGRFDCGAHGAGVMARQGAFWGYDLPSGQGGGIRTQGAVTVAAFVVANPVGLIVGRDGRCLSAPHLPPELSTIAAQGARLPLDRSDQPMNPANTTISVIVTNAILPLSALQRLAVQTQSSMGRAIQPFACPFDGDTLFATSTGAVPLEGVTEAELGWMAGEAMWDALLSVV